MEQQWFDGIRQMVQMKLSFLYSIGQPFTCSERILPAHQELSKAAPSTIKESQQVPTAPRNVEEPQIEEKENR